MINFWKYRAVYFTISAVVIIAGLISIFTYGYRYSIDFVGGTNLEYRFNKPVTETKLRPILASDKVEVIDMRDEGLNTFLIRTKAIDEQKEKTLRGDIENETGTKITVLRTETVGPVLGRETMIKTLIAATIAVVGILIYMSFAFKGWKFAVAAILALLHDILVVLGCYSLMSKFFGAEVDTMFVTAILTSMSFSVHDTIVIFDKIREYIKSEGHGDTVSYANRALTETLVRSANNSMTIIFMLLALTLMGGTTIRFFIASLLIGTITGTYSSPFVATPILVWLEGMGKKK